MRYWRGQPGVKPQEAPVNLSFISFIVGLSLHLSSLFGLGLGEAIACLCVATVIGSQPSQKATERLKALLIPPLILWTGLPHRIVFRDRRPL